jgi:hypothetical protein
MLIAIHYIIPLLLTLLSHLTPQPLRICM